MMVRRLAIVLMMLLAASAFAQVRGTGGVQQSSTTEWNDKSVFEQNRLYPRSNVIPYSKEDDIEKLLYTKSPYYISLNGQWKMDLQDHFSDRATEFESRGFSTDSWTTVSVPDGYWNFGNKKVKVPSLKSVLDIPSRGNYTATYYREFDAPKYWSDYSAFLRLQASSAFYLWVNKTYVGYCEDSRSLAEFDITRYLKYGKSNSIIVQVVGLSTGSLLEMNANPTCKGITSDVAICLKSAVNVQDYTIVADYDAANTIGSFSVDLNLFNRDQKGKYYVEMELWDPQGKQQEKMGKWVLFKKRSEIGTTLSCMLPKVSPWTAESPNRYTMVVRLLNEDMEVLETVGTRFGFRSVEVHNGELRVNGKAISLRGTLYNNYSPEGVLSHEQMERDVKMMKQHNINAVRTAYASPFDTYFYELCDAYGLYVVCDANIHPFSTQSKAIATDNDYQELFVVRAQNMYEQLKNSCSVIAWSLGDSRDNGVCMTGTYKALKAKDKTRPVLCGSAEYADNSDVVATFNGTTDNIRQYLAKPQKRPLVLLTYGSSQGNGFGGMERLWEQVRNHTNVVGGFVNCWNDVEYYDLQKEQVAKMDGFVSVEGKERNCLRELSNLYRPFDVKLVKISPDDAEFAITNLLDFSDLSDYQVEYAIFSNLKPRIVEGDVMMALNPGETKNFKLRVPALTLYAGEELFIRFVMHRRKGNDVVPKSTELGVVEFQLPTKVVAKSEPPAYVKKPLQISFDTVRDSSAAKISMVHVTNGVAAVDFDMIEGNVVSYRYKNTEMLRSGLSLDFWRQPTDNDRADKNAYRLWHAAGLDNLRREVVAIQYYQKDAYTVDVDVMLRYFDHSDYPVFDVKQTFTVLHSGDVLVDNEVMASDRVKSLPRLGMDLMLTTHFDTVEWFGLDKESYSDRQGGCRMGTYRCTLSKMGSSEGGNRAGVRYVAFENSNVGMYVDLSDSVFNLSYEQGSQCAHIDFKYAGIGAALAGVALQPSDLLQRKSYHFQLHLCGYDRMDNDPYDFRQVSYPKVKSGLLEMPVITTDRDRFDGPMHVTITSKNAKSEIRYTLDGTIPDEKSPRYTAPLLITGSTIVKARAFSTGMSSSFTAVARCVYDYVSSTTFANKPNTPYNQNYLKALFDGETGEVEDLSRGWIGFSGNDCVVTAKLSKVVDLDDVQLRFAHVPDAWTFAPKSITVLVSSDGKNFTDTINATLTYDPSSEEMNAPQLVAVSVPVDRDNVQYVRIIARNMGRIPSWHKAKGLRSWIMIDEVLVNEKVKR